MRNPLRFDRNTTLALFILFLTLWGISYSIAADSVDKDTESKGRKIPSFLPFVIRTPETGFGGGVGGIHTFRIGEPGPQDRVSSFSLSAKYTQEKQYAIQLTPRFYLKEEKYYLWSDILYQKFPFQFYGIGNDNSDDTKEDYTPEELKVWLTLRRKIYSGLSVGVQYNFEDLKISEVKKAGLLAGGDILGYDGGRNSGVGLLALWDSCDRAFCARNGALYKASAMIYRDSLGGDFDFIRYTLDLRRYFTILPTHSVALQGYFDFLTGDPPFQKLALLGGRDRMRGYYEGKFRDRNMIALQVEYRIVPIWWRIGMVGFLGVGDVNDEMSDLQLKDFKTAAGIGFRFQFNRDEGVNLRADFAYGEDGLNYYLTILEAF